MWLSNEVVIKHNFSNLVKVNCDSAVVFRNNFTLSNILIIMRQVIFIVKDSSTKLTNVSWFTHSQVVPNVLKEDILKNVGNQAVDVIHWLPLYLFKHFASRLVTNILQNILFCVQQLKITHTCLEPEGRVSLTNHCTYRFIQCILRAHYGCRRLWLHEVFEAAGPL